MPPAARSATSEALERKVRAVYEALDSNSYKNALKLCDGLLDKYPDNHLVLSLKALTLQRQGKMSQAMTLCDQLMATLPIDESALHIMRILLKALKRLDDLTRMHEAAVEADPGDMDALESLFAAYAREGKFLQQQQIAMKLLKASGGQERYQWWIVLTLMLQVQSSLSQPSGAATDQAMKLLQLAESMAARQAKSNKVEGFEALLLYLDLLLARGKPQEALALLEGPVGASVLAQEDERRALLADLLAVNGDWAGAGKVLQERLGRNPDDWTALQRYLDCQLPDTADSELLQTSTLIRFDGSLAALLPPASAQPRADHQLAGDRADALADCEQIVNQMLAQAGSSGSGTRGSMRGPHLAKVELAWRRLQLAQRSNQEPSIQAASQSFAEAVLSYWQVAGALVSCAADLRSYLPHVPQEQASWLWQELGGDSLLAEPASGSWTGQSEVRQRVSALQLCADMHMPALTDAPAALEYAHKLMRMYTAALPLYEGLDERERGPADELPCLAAGAIMQAACATDSTVTATQLSLVTLLMLEATVVKRPYASGIRLALTALHSLFGSTRQAAAHMTALDIKNIQLDTLGSHLLLPCLLASGGLVEGKASGDKDGGAEPKYGLLRLLKETHMLYTEHQRDAGDTLDMAYRHGMYSKVLEFVAFKQRLDSSHTLAVTRVELLATHLRTAAAQCPADSSLSKALGSVVSSSWPSWTIPWLELPPAPSQGTIRFNEDLATRPGWYPPQPAPAPLSAASWWAHRQHASPTARASTAWWMKPAAAEAARDEAKTLRDRLLSSVRVRWCQVHLLTRALSQLQACQEQAVAGLVPDSQQALTALTCSLGCPDPERLDEWLQQQAGAFMTTTAYQPVELLSAGVLATGVALAQTCSVSSVDETTIHAQLTARIKVTQHMLQQLVASLSSELQAGSEAGLPIPGGVLAILSILITEAAAWFLATLEATVGLHTASRKGRKPGAASADAPIPPVLVIVEAAATALQPALQQLQATLKTAHQSLTEQQVASPADQRLVQGHTADVRALWAWQPGAHTALAAVVQDQQLQVSKMMGLVASFLQRSTRLASLRA